MKQLIQGLTAERKKQLDHDLIAIGVITFIALTLIMVVFGKQFNGAIYDKTSPVLPRVALAAVCGQFALAGLGITAVCLYRKEKFTGFGLTKKNLAPALFLSLACCVPDFIYQIAVGNVHPLVSVHRRIHYKGTACIDLPRKGAGICAYSNSMGFL